VFELDAYLQRIGVAGRPSPADLHTAHATSIPFEGLNAHLGAPIPLDARALAAKMVAGARGGYCFEQNLLLKAALEALGYEVEPYLARVRVGLSPGQVRGRTHLLLRVLDGERSWHADVGFGSGTLLAPLPWGPGEAHEQAGWQFRVSERGGEWALQTLDAGEWWDLYTFLPHPVPPIDVEMSNWWTATHPDSGFVSGFLVTRHWRDGRRLILSDWGELSLLERDPDQTRRIPLTLAQVPALLAERFELPGFELDGEGRLALADSDRR
jgi:N-hydroxyarylamine O-acetyltransferase